MSGTEHDGVRAGSLSLTLHAFWRPLALWSLLWFVGKLFVTPGRFQTGLRLRYPVFFVAKHRPKATPAPLMVH